MKRKDKLFAQCYQLAAHLLLDDLTEGQRDRLTQLLLDILSEPDRFRPRDVRVLRRQAVKP